jgi:hypothetical protein
MTSRCTRNLRGRSRISAERTARSARSSRGPGWVRRSTATSCRSTSSSAFLDAAGRPSMTSQPQSRTKMRQSRRTDTADHDASRLALAQRCSSQARQTFGTPQAPRLATRKWDDTNRRRPGRPSTAAAIRKLVIRIATENPTCGHRRVHGELVRLGHPIASSTVWQILHAAGIGPAPRWPGLTWKQILTTQARGILAADFVHVDTVLLRRIYASIVIEHGTRRVHLAGITANPDDRWTTQAARNLLMDLGQRAASARFLIRDRAGQFTGSFDAVFAADGIRILASPPQAPRANAICERIIGTLRRELSGRLLIVNEHHLRQVLTEYLRHDNTARPHRSLGQLAPAHAHTPATADQPRRAPNPPATSPRRTHARIPDRRMTCPALLQKEAGHRQDRVFEPNTILEWQVRKVLSRTCCGQVSRQALFSQLKAAYSRKRSSLRSSLEDARS